MKTQTNLLWKKLAFIAIGVLSFLLVSALFIPFLIDVDKYRSEIQEKISSEINGSLVLGKLKLSLWGTLSIRADGAELRDLAQKSILSVKDCQLKVPLISVLKASPVVNIEMNSPVVNVVKNKNGQWNVAQLAKKNLSAPTEKSEPEKPVEKREPKSKSDETGASMLQVPSEPQGTGASSHSSTSLPSWVRNASIGIRISNATLQITDEKTDHHYSLKNINFMVDSLSLSRPSAFKLAAQLDSPMGPKQVVRGPFEIKGSLKGSDLEVEANADQLNIEWGQAFVKTEKVPARVGFKMRWSPQEIVFDEGTAQIHRLELNWKGNVGDWSSSQSPQIAFEFKSKEMFLKDFLELIPMASDYRISGTALAAGQVSGSLIQPKGKFELSLTQGQAQGDTLKQKLDFEGQVQATLEKIDRSWLAVKASGLDLRADLKAELLAEPRFQLDVQSREFDLDQLVDWERFKKRNTAPVIEKKRFEIKLSEKKGRVEIQSQGKEEGRTVPVPDFDAPVALLRENPYAKKASGVVNCDFKSIKSHGVVIEPVRGKGILKNLKVNVSLVEANLFGGKLKGDMDLDLVPQRPEYNFKIATTQLDLQKAVASQWALFKNTMNGILTGEVTGKGASFDPVLAKKNLNASGKMKVERATLSTVDVNPLLSEAVNQGINKVAEKIPQLRGKAVKLDKISSEFQQVTSTFTIKDGTFRAPDFWAQAVPQKGVDLKGETEVGLIDYALRADWELIDTYNVTKLKDLSVEESGIQVPALLVEKGQPFKLPMKVRGTLLNPEYEYAAVPEYLGRIALANISKAAQERAKAEVNKRAQEELKKVTDQGAQKVKDALKGIFGH